MKIQNCYRYEGKDDPTQKVIRRWYKIAEAQANFRGEDWQVSWNHFRNCWTINENYKSRGRGSTALCFSRIDTDLPWTDSNTKVMIRHEYLIRPRIFA